MLAACSDTMLADAYAKAMGIRPTPGGFSFPGGAFSMSGMNPEAEKAFKEMYKQWQQYMQSEMGRAGSSSPSTPSGTPSLPLDVTQDDLKYVVYADVPGLAKSDLSIKLSKDNVLTISGARKPPISAEETAEGSTNAANSFLLQQRPAGSFERKWTLPEDADTAAISAKVTDGVLMVTIGKKVAEPEVDDTQDIPWV